MLGIVTRGRSNAAQWVLSYAVTGQIGMKKVQLMDSRTGNQVFLGNVNMITTEKRRVYPSMVLK